MSSRIGGGFEAMGCEVGLGLLSLAVQSIKATTSSRLVLVCCGGILMLLSNESSSSSSVKEGCVRGVVESSIVDLSFSGESGDAVSEFMGVVKDTRDVVLGVIWVVVLTWVLSVVLLNKSGDVSADF